MFHLEPCGLDEVIGEHCHEELVLDEENSPDRGAAGHFGTVPDIVQVTNCEDVYIRLGRFIGCKFKLEGIIEC
jgi:hypothetical protein